MIRLSLSALIALACPLAALADSINLHSDYAVDQITVSRPDAVMRGRVEGKVGHFYGGVAAATLPQPDDAADVDVYFGMRPTLGPVAMDVNYARDLEADCCGDLALVLSRPLGERAQLGARVRYDAAGETAETEARASVTVFRGTSLGGGVGTRLGGGDAAAGDVGFDVGLSRQLAAMCALNLRYRDAIAAAPRAEMSLNVNF